LKTEKPFFGVPFTTKDCFAVTGLSYTAGLKERGRRKTKADFDADAIILVRFLPLSWKSIFKGLFLVKLI
jgi:Asp-tRNA(Asn)/Glu-tRNA(Gln) amidotransferase A subunit family amidase